MAKELTKMANEWDELFLQFAERLQDGMACRVAEKMKESAKDAPRVLGLDEIPTFDGAVLIECRGCEASELEWALYDEVNRVGMHFAVPRSGPLMARLDDYGVEWRAWTQRPSEARREAEPWRGTPQTPAEGTTREPTARERVLWFLQELQDIGNTCLRLTREAHDILRAIEEGEPCED